MHWIRHCFLALAFGALAGCDNSGAGQTEVLTAEQVEEQQREAEAATRLGTAFRSPDASGNYPSDITSLFRGSYQDGDGNGYAIGLHQTDTQISALAGLIPGTTGGGLPVAGTASMGGRYHVAEIGQQQGDRDFGEPQFTIGEIVLRANFEQGILSGSDGFLTVDGSFASTRLQGGVTFNGRAATLEGRIGGDRAVGVFHGTDSTTAMVGGFLVTP